jgi:anti-sigma regulatory factor (Ser/Thr protein kinase)
LVNVAYARFTILALCPYNARTLPPSIIADAYRTHPELHDGSKSRPSPKFVDPRTFICELDQQEKFPEPQARVRHLLFDGDLGGLRRFVADEARRADVASNKLEELEWVANEIAINVVRHGDGMAMVRTWSNSEEFVCEIKDQGRGLKDPLVGLPPTPDQESPSGLWLAHQLCDLVEIRSSASGLTARLHVTRDAADKGLDEV